MARKVIVFQHNPWEGPGKFLLQAARQHRMKLDVIQVWREALPALDGCAALIVLGGSPNVNQEHLYPFLTKEKEAILEAIARDIPYLGFCLGHQLLADVLGARVGPNFQPSIGYIQGFLTHAGRTHPVFSDLPQNIPLFKWHSQSIQEPLPGHISILATSAQCQIEAISLPDRPHILGLQFDNHAAAREDIKNWLIMDAKWLATLNDGGANPAALLNDARKHEATIEKQFTKLFDNFFHLFIN